MRVRFIFFALAMLFCFAVQSTAIAASWEDTHDPDSNADGTEKVFVENGATDANNWMLLSTIATYVRSTIADLENFLTAESDPTVNALGKATLNPSIGQGVGWNGTEWVVSEMGNGEVNVQADYNQSDTGADDYIKNKPNLGAAALLDVGTEPGDIVQLGAACTVGDGAYTDQSTCEANSGEWVGVLSIICDADTEDCDSKLDLLSAAEIDQRIADGKTISTSQPTGGMNGDVWYVVE